MKSRLNTLRAQHWATRSQNERRSIVAGGALLLPLLGYFIFWQPAHDAVKKLHHNLPQLHIQTEQIRQAAVKVEEMRHRPQIATLDASAVTAAIDESATRHQLRALFTTLSAQEPNGTRLTASSISFEKWISWLRELEQSQHIRVDSLSITPLAQPGMVAVRATLTNGATQ